MHALQVPPPNRAVDKLSGGEKRRVGLCRLLLEHPDMLLLDEPTNDLDLDPLRVLEEGISHYPGCMIIVTHDRYFLDKVATHILAFEEDGSVVYHQGDFESYKRSRGEGVKDAATTHRKFARQGKATR